MNADFYIFICENLRQSASEKFSRITQIL